MLKDLMVSVPTLYFSGHKFIHARF